MPFGSVACPFHNARTAGLTPLPSGQVTINGGEGFAQLVSRAARLEGERETMPLVTETAELLGTQLRSEVGSHGY